MEMKQFKIKSELIFRADEKGYVLSEALYVCDPELNTECRKTHCGEECTMTKEMIYAKRFNVNE
ncbi:hypothetical protein ACPA0F_09060 [Solibacillus silvestris]